MSVYGIGTGYFAWQATEKIQKNNAGTDFADMIANKEIQKAALDVFEDEPLAVDSPLYEVQDQLILTPHVAWASVEARQHLVEEVYQNIEAFLNGRERNIVNH